MKSNAQPAELTKLQKYLDLKKKNCLREADKTLNDFKSDLTEQIYNREDVEDLLDKLTKDLGNTYSQEIDHLIHAATSYVGAALKEAERNGFEINVDVDFLDNKEAMESLRAATRAIAKKVAEGYKGSIEDLLVEIEMLKTKNKKQQEELSRLSDEKDLSELRPNKGPGAGASSQEVAELQKKLTQYQAKNEELSADMNKKLNESTQFNNLKKMMQTRNEQMKKLRDRLSKYENVEDIKMD